MIREWRRGREKGRVSTLSVLGELFEFLSVESHSISHSTLTFYSISYIIYNNGKSIQCSEV